MNTLDDLRGTLAGHADDLAHSHFDPRVATVHARIARVRRQRRAALAGCVAAIVLAIAGVVGIVLPGQHSASPALVAGHALAPTVQVDGMAYDLGTATESKPGQTTLRITLPKADRGRAVALVANGLGDGTATLYSGNGKPAYIGAGGAMFYDAGSVLDRITGGGAVDQPIVIAPEETRLTVRLRNTPATAVAAVAVYQQGTVFPAGVSANGMVFPQQIGSHHLVAATIGRVGQDSVSITFTGPVRNPDLEDLCATDEKHILRHITENGVRGWSGGECSPLDPTNDVNLGVNHAEGVPSKGYGPGRHTVTLRVFRGTFKRGTPADLADGRLALALYDDRSPVRHVAGSDWDTRMNDGARIWRLDRVVPFTGTATVDATSGPVMLGESYRGRTSSCLIATAADGEQYESTCTGSTPGPGAAWGTVLMPGTTYTITTRDYENDTKPGRGLKDLLIYRLAD